MPKIQEYTEFNNIGDDFVFLTEKRNTEENPINPTLITTFGNLKNIIWNWISGLIKLTGINGVSVDTTLPNVNNDNINFSIRGRNFSEYTGGNQYYTGDICWWSGSTFGTRAYYRNKVNTSSNMNLDANEYYWEFMYAPDTTVDITVTTSVMGSSSNWYNYYDVEGISSWSSLIVSFVYDATLGTYEDQVANYNSMVKVYANDDRRIHIGFGSKKPTNQFKIRVRGTHGYSSASEKSIIIPASQPNLIDDTLTESTTKTWSIDKIKTEIDNLSIPEIKDEETSSSALWSSNKIETEINSVPTKIINNTEVEPTVSTWSVNRIMEVLSAFITVNEETVDALPETGEAGKVYVVGANKYVWVVSASQFIKIA